MQQPALSESRNFEISYKRLENYLYLDSTGQTCFIKPTNFDQKRKKQFKKQIGRVENMTYNQEETCFICAQGRRPELRKERTELKGGQPASTTWCRCESCAGCSCCGQC